MKQTPKTTRVGSRCFVQVDGNAEDPLLDKLDENSRRLDEAARKHAEDEKRRREWNAEKARQRQGKFEEAKHIEETRINQIVTKAEVVEKKLEEVTILCLNPTVLP
eukprot:1095996-Prorocentrum_minimum.AAC.1